MRVASIMVAIAVAVLSACTIDGATAPAGPSLAVLAEGNPPPPRVLGRITTTFSASSGAFRAARQYVFRGSAYFNRNLATGMNVFEMATGPGHIRADAAGVVIASGIVVLVDPATRAQVSFDLSQLAGYTGPVFGACPPGSPVNCLVFNTTLSGTVRPVGRPAVPATGFVKFRWDTN